MGLLLPPFCWEALSNRSAGVVVLLTSRGLWVPSHYVWWQHVLGQGSRAVRSLCHTSLQAGHGQPTAQPGVLKTQGSFAHLQGCLPWLFSNRLRLTPFVRLCSAAVWWSSGCGGYSEANQTTRWVLLLEEELWGDPTKCPFMAPSHRKSTITHTTKVNKKEEKLYYKSREGGWIYETLFPWM